MSTYSSLIDMVRNEGKGQSSRFGKTLEVIGFNWTSIPGVVPLRRGHNRKLGYMELLQVMSGIFDEELVAKAAPKAAKALFTSQMAGGPRVGLQPAKLIETLQRDPDSRQCVVFWDRPSDSFSSDLACTVCAQFLLRDGRLHIISTMRSWDLIRGLPYDLTIFGGLQMTVAQLLNVLPGTLTVNAGSAHIYLHDLEDGVDRSPIGKNLHFEIGPWTPGMPWAEVQALCRRQAYTVEDWPQKAPWIVTEHVEEDPDEL
jgi:hypothetical protein